MDEILDIKVPDSNVQYQWTALNVWQLYIALRFQSYSIQMFAQVHKDTQKSGGTVPVFDPSE